MFIESLTLFAASVAAQAPAHNVTVEHRGTPIVLSYQAVTEISHRQVGAATPAGVPSSLRCTWEATVSVQRTAERAGEAVPALTRRLPETERLTGSRPGPCAGARDAIAREVAASSERVSAHLIEVAERDRAEIHAELESVRNLG